MNIVTFLKRNKAKKIYIGSIVCRIIFLTGYKKYYDNDELSILKKINYFFFYFSFEISPLIIIFNQKVQLIELNKIKMISNFIIQILTKENIEPNSIISNRLIISTINIFTSFYQFLYCFINIKYTKVEYIKLTVTNFIEIIIVPILFFFIIQYFKIDIPDTFGERLITGFLSKLTTYEIITTVINIIIIPATLLVVRMPK